MPRAPSVIFIARHGARLDAEDQKWTDTAAAPYDTPLSYGGWTQTRALGARIASLLHANDDEHDRRSNDSEREVEDDLPKRPARESKKQRKRRIIIHTSPFLRCVQSAVAVSAGIAQFKGNLAKARANEARSNQSPRYRSLNQPPQALIPSTGSSEQDLLRLAATAQPGREASTDNATFEKPDLRVDAFLGEWLSSQYYETIRAPPPSGVMLTGAKAELAQLADTVRGSLPNGGTLQMKLPNLSNLPNGPHEPNASNAPTTSCARNETEAANAPNATKASNATNEPNRTNWPDGTNEPKEPQEPNKIERPDEKTDTKSSDALPTSRTAGHITFAQNTKQGLGKNGSQRAARTTERSRNRISGYIPPQPNYALSSAEPIPPGYVAHARDECVRVDLDWDSTNEPQNWGDGGHVDEEWSSMHKRFRRGFAGMIAWYSGNNESLLRRDVEGESDSEEDIALVLVTHSAGCNALIGALTNQPVLIDVGMGALTMAKRKDRVISVSPDASRTPYSRRRRRSSANTDLSTSYEMKMIANTEHLRAGSNPAQIPLLQLSASLSSIREQRSRGSSGTSSPDEWPMSRNSALGSILRKTSSTMYGARLGTAASTTGLWRSRESTMTPADADSGEDEPDDGVVNKQVEQVASLQSLLPAEVVQFETSAEQPRPAVSYQEAKPVVVASGLWAASTGNGRNGSGLRGRMWSVHET